MSEAQEFERTPVQPTSLQPARHFAASYAGEHVAGTEFVIGALFVAWGVSTGDILWGLLWGNLLAVLTWALVCAPIAVQTRLTLYAYLEKISGPGTIKLYSVVNGILFCILAGTMITVSASAVRILFHIPVQLNWYPTSIAFVLVALAVGAVVVTIAIKGFKRVAQFAEVCAPWMVLMFIAGALSMLPVLFANTPGLENEGFVNSFFHAADQLVWQDTDKGFNIWHVIAFSWICNFAMHGGLSDMTILRFARKSSYGYFSAFGMFLGHYVAWVCAGIMGAGAGLLLKSSITQMDPGAVAFEALGAAGIIAVIIAGWTTSNPTIYRAGLAFQSLNHKWNRVTVTIIVGIATTIVACFPFVFNQLMNFVGLMGLVLAPIGAVIVTEHWLFPRLGLTRYWISYAGRTTNWASLIAWGGSLLIAFLLARLGLHLFFLMIPTLISATIIYIVLASFMGARVAYTEQVAEHEKAEAVRRELEEKYLQDTSSSVQNKKSGSVKQKAAGLVAILSLIACTVMAVMVFNDGALETFRTWLILPSVIYFIAATLWAIEKEKTEA